MCDEKVLFFRLEVKFINSIEAGSDQLTYPTDPQSNPQPIMEIPVV